MSLSVERPMVCAPAGIGMAPDRDGRSALNIFVARFATSGGLAEVGAICVCGDAGEGPALSSWGCG